MLAWTKDWLSPKTVIDLINTDRPQAIVAFLGIALSISGLFGIFYIYSNHGVIAEEMERMIIEKDAIMTEIDHQNTELIIEGSRIMGIELDKNIYFANQSARAAEALKINKKLILYPTESLTEKQRSENFESSVNRVQKSYALDSRLNSYRIKERVFSARIQREEFIFRVSNYRQSR